jgi:hypothetical protein
VSCRWLASRLLGFVVPRCGGMVVARRIDYVVEVMVDGGEGCGSVVEVVVKGWH